MQFKFPVIVVSLFFLPSIFLLLLPESAKAQAVSRPERGALKVTTYEETEVDRVDLRNGNLFLAIPLASLPKMSGGKIGLTINAHYNSKLWDSYLREEFIPGAPDHEISGPPTFYTADVPKLSPSGGWRIGERYELVIESASSDFVRSVARSSGNDIDHAEINSHSWHKTFLVSPDGSRHELRPIGLPMFGGATDFYRGYQRTGPNLLGRPIDYHSFDGTFLRVRIFPTGSELEWRVLQTKSSTSISSTMTEIGGLQPDRRSLHPRLVTTVKPTSYKL